jgi:hypothetical protein
MEPRVLPYEFFLKYRSPRLDAGHWLQVHINTTFDHTTPHYILHNGRRLPNCSLHSHILLCINTCITLESQIAVIKDLVQLNSRDFLISLVGLCLFYSNMDLHDQIFHF